MKRRVLLLAMGLLATAALSWLFAGSSDSGADPNGEDPLSIGPVDNIMRPEHLGIANHRMTTSVPYETVGTVAGLWAVPYVSSDWRLVPTLDGEPVAVADYRWYPVRFVSSGSRGGVELQSNVVLIAGRRAAVGELSLRNRSDEIKEGALTLSLTPPTLDKTDEWLFSTRTSETPAATAEEPGALCFTQGESGICLAAEGELSLDDDRPRCRFDYSLGPNETAVFYYTVAIGPAEEARRAAGEIAADPRGAIAESLKAYRAEREAIAEYLPALESDNSQWVGLYDRSLLHFFTNRWEGDGFLLRPYYATGGMSGGCTCCYQWNFGEPWEILPLWDPEAAKAHIKQFLSIDLTEHFAFTPVTGAGYGPWYMVNQEKILGLIYYYVRVTGDTAFLAEQVSGRTIAEHVAEQAYVHEDPNGPVELIDYGSSNSHLELRRASDLYNHVMPDLNGRRYANYLMADTLLRLAGQPDQRLVKRAEALKALLKERLWNRETNWFDFLDGDWRPRTRWTIQMYKLFGSGVLDEEQTAGLLAHWNETEFLGPYGVHSLAKQDEWFDPADVDNGGPGACTDFGPQIAERFYKSGHAAEGDDILRRMLWLGSRMPYWGDSVYASEMNYRHDTPLQCMFDSVTIAQSILFGTFGLSCRFDGAVEVTPVLPSFARYANLRHVRLRGELFDLEVRRDGFAVILPDGQRIDAPAGKTIELSGQKGRVLDSRTRSEDGLILY